MAAPENITGLTAIEDFEDTDNPPNVWMIGPVDVGNAAIDAGIYKQGTHSGGCSIGFAAAWVGGIGVEVGDGGGINGVDLSASDCFLWVWALLAPRMLSNLEIKNNGGLRLRLYSGTFTDDGDDKLDETNTWVEYWVGGIDSLSADWNRVVLNPINTTPTNSNGTFDYTNVTVIGFTYKLASAYGGGAARALFMDGICTGTGIKFSGGTADDKVTIEDIADYTEAADRAWGICVSDKGVWRLNGTFDIGVIGFDTYFEVDSRLIVFEDQSYYESGATVDSSVNEALQGINGIADGVNVTDIRIVNSVLHVGGTYGAFDINFNDSNLNVEITGNTISRAKVFTVAAGHIVSGVFNVCGQIIPNSAQFTNFTIRNYLGLHGGLLWPSVSNIANGRFVTCLRAIEHGIAGAYEYDSLTFEDCINDVHNSTVGTVDITLVNGSNAATYINTNGGTTNIVNTPVLLSFSVQDENGVAMTGYEWRLYDDQGILGEYGTELDGEETATSSDQSYEYTYVEDDGYFLQVIKEGYVERKTKGMLVNNDQNLTIIMRTENN